MENNIGNKKIETLEQAKAYYFAMGCSKFHLDREDFERRDEYYSLNISRDIENEWANEHILEKYQLLMKEKPRKELWIPISYFIDLVENHTTIENIMLVYNIIEKYHKTLPPFDMVLVAESLEGRRIKPSGIIIKAKENKLNKEAKTLTIWAKEMALEATNKNKSLEKRGSSVINKLDKLLQSL